MIKDIITYPTPTGIEYAPDIRFFDEELYTFIDDLKETAEANSLEGLAATQVGSYYNVVVVKHDGEFLELLNPRIFKKHGSVRSIESSAYFPNVSVEIERYETVNLVYEDRFGESHSLKADGDFSILLQRKIDYLYGANFLTKLKDEEKEEFETLLLSNGMSCPVSPSKFSRDYFVKAANYIMIGMVGLLAASLFISTTSTLEKLWSYQLYLSFVVLGIYISYLIYSYYENKRYSVCTNCFNMSIYGVTVIGLVRLSILMIISYFLINPS
jgi:peptide deformylase